MAPSGILVAMDVGLIGLPASGKTTIFRLLTGAPAGARAGVAEVPDPRLHALAAIFHPKKVTPATIRLLDFPGFVPGKVERRALHALLEALVRGDALLHVVRAFDDPAMPHPLESPDPLRDARLVEEELILTDLDHVERVAERLAKNRSRRPEEERQYQALRRAAEALAEGVPLRAARLGREELACLRGFGVLTDKPEVLAINVGEEGLAASAQWESRWPELVAWCGQNGIPWVPFCARVEGEIASLPAEEQQAFLASYGLAESGVQRLARAVYGACGLISFLTAGEDEVRAWPVRRGTPARQAAGKVHSDMERGFIRAEVASWEDLVAVGSWKALREQGRVRLEGKDYVVQDGDVITFRFHVAPGGGRSG